MKAHVRKKVYRLSIKRLALKGFVNDAEGRMVPKNQVKESSMTRDYYPQRSV